ncbi:MAG: hypothetical protein HY855_01825 [Burkholderiales bacterium]|nr:hypothetical protein [Burkholderiales bacterium]
MSLLKHALQNGARRVPPAPRATAAQHLVVAGGAGPLGSAVLERALGNGPWARVTALVTQPVEVALRGLVAQQASMPPADHARLSPPARSALVVFDRERSHHGREAAFLRPQPAQLPALASWLQREGVRHLVLVMPHAPALLPQALKAGLATLDEQAIAALGFEHFVVVRPARAEAGARPTTDARLGWAARWLTGLSRALLSQLHWMVPQRDQPLRATQVAAFVVALAAELPHAPPGTRVVPPELLFDWAQPAGGAPLMQAWLHGTAHPQPTPLRRAG